MLPDPVRHRLSKASGWIAAERPRPIKLSWELDPEDYAYWLVLTMRTNQGDVVTSCSQRRVVEDGGVLNAARNMRRNIASALMLSRVFAG